MTDITPQDQLHEFFDCIAVHTYISPSYEELSNILVIALEVLQVNGHQMLVSEVVTKKFKFEEKLRELEGS